MGRTGFSWLRIDSKGRLLWAPWWTFGFHRESRLLFDNLSDYQLFKEYPAPWSRVAVLMLKCICENRKMNWSDNRKTDSVEVKFIRAVVACSLSLQTINRPTDIRTQLTEREYRTREEELVLIHFTDGWNK
jgi:hypothetical protein